MRRSTIDSRSRTASGASLATARPAGKGQGGKVDARPLPAGLPARQWAAGAVSGVLLHGRTFDDAIANARGAACLARMEPRDRAFARLLAMTVLRHTGELRAVVSSFLARPLADKHREVGVVLLLGAAQLLLLSTPAHAAISLAVEQCRRTQGGAHLDKLVNAVLRRVAADGPALRAGLDSTRLNIPDWMWRRWARVYGEDIGRRIADASLTEAALDISVKNDPASWAATLGGEVLPTGSVRVAGAGRIEEMAGYGEGAWWVQDMAAALPAKLLGPVAGCRVADLCAAPGGKTAELAALGGRVTAVDASAARIARVVENLARLRLKADLVAADLLEWDPGETFDAVLLDAPCTATGTIRRHPDILHLKRETDIAALADLQARMLERAVHLVAPGGTIVYCTCSMEPEEGVEQIERLLAAHDELQRASILPTEVGGEAGLLTAAGDLRTLPFHSVGSETRWVGMDGFYAARLRKVA